MNSEENQGLLGRFFGPERSHMLHVRVFMIM